jgi:hypothetical protein
LFSLTDFDPQGQAVDIRQKTIAFEVIGRVQASLSNAVANVASVNVAVFESFGELTSVLSYLAKEIKARQDALALASSTVEARRQSKQALEQAIAICQYREQFDSQVPRLIGLCREVKHHKAMAELINLINFPVILRNITTAMSNAYGELVVDEFTRRLNAEYVALCGRTMEQLGISLARRGEAQDIIINAHIAGNEIHRVLSEGERKIHALAMFFSELATGSWEVAVFDDPVDSFDYNNADNYARRLRDIIQQFPLLQVIVLTHNWHYFVQLQTVLNKANLSQAMSVMVLENCDTVAEYSDRVDKLKAEIHAILALTGEPNAKTKADLSALLRRLVEAVVNVHVFNDERHQFKQKTQAVTEFGKFTKLVPLTDAEATNLRDLYSDLSPPEHDDPRNFYVSKNKVQFQHWYDQIMAIEAQLLARRP